MVDSTSPRKVGLSVLLFLIGAGALVAMFWNVLNGPPAVGPQPPDANAQRLTRAQSQELVETRNRAIAALENGDFEEADRLLRRVIEIVPEDPLGPRNLTICRELALDKFDPSQMQPALASADTALELLIKADPDSSITQILAARLAARQGDLDRAAVALRQATTADPGRAAFWYDFYLLRPAAPGETPTPETVDALRNTYELEPDNLFVLKDWLPLQAQLKDPAISETVTRARQTLAPFAEIIKTNIRVDLLALLDRLAAAVAANQWNVAVSSAMTIRNVIVAEAARDERYVKRNSLEYLLTEFEETTLQRLDLPERPDVGVPVTFTAQPLQNEGPVLDRVVVDLDLDGVPDSLVLDHSRLTLARSLLREPKVQGVDLGPGFRRILAVDLDEDVDPKLKDRAADAVHCAAADPDVVVYGEAGVKLFETVRDGANVELREKPAADSLGTLQSVLQVLPGDLDLDGDLDLTTLTPSGIQLWSNRGNWSFQEITDRALRPDAEFEPVSGIALDWDRDSDLDLLIAGQSSVGVLESLRHGRFRWRELGGDFEKVRGATALCVEQLPGRPSWSVIGAGAAGVVVVRTETSSAGVVTAQSAETLTARPVTRLSSLDYDNDGCRDLVAGGPENLSMLYRGTPDGRFSEAAAPIVSVRGQFGGVADIDGDGDEDLVTIGPDSGWFRNDGGNANGWLNVSLVAMQIKANEQNYSRRVNHVGIGSLLELKSGQGYQAQVVQGSTTQFGLGPDKAADVLRILWSNGIPQNAVSPEANRWICEQQKLHGSCPYLYAWDGTRFAFVTDLLWNAPLGLKFAEDVIAPWREWEHLKIEGRQLQPASGEYRLRITAELWEVEYFDEVRLTAVDHPAGTQIFTNEKVGPPSLAEHRIHTVSQPRTPVAARDQSGRDLLAQIASVDGDFTSSYERKLAQGLTTPHFLELDLGDWTEDRPADALRPGEPAAAAITLYLTGWMYPGSTSLSVQHSQNPDQARPQPPSLHAIDADGNWRLVRPFLGFPGGKTKTIAIDLTDVFPPDSRDHRIRIATNMEFYWDGAFFTVDEPPVPVRQTELTLTRADLIDRGGVSHREWPKSGNGPELFDYEHLVPGDAWPPIDGRFTRFGDVRELVQSRDDYLVVMHPGDELQLAFAELPPPPSGWVRDFVISSVGWDKDCDLNTVYGETAEPLPFEKMSVYGQPRDQDPAYRDYLQRYQTRTRLRGPFWNSLSR